MRHTWACRGKINSQLGQKWTGSKNCFMVSWAHHHMDLIKILEHRSQSVDCNEHLYWNFFGKRRNNFTIFSNNFLEVMWKCTFIKKECFENRSTLSNFDSVAKFFLFFFYYKIQLVSFNYWIEDFEVDDALCSTFLIYFIFFGDK